MQVRRSDRIPIIPYPGQGYDRLMRAVHARARARQAAVEAAVAEIDGDIQSRGDRALCEYVRRFDGIAVSPTTLRIPAGEIAAAAATTDPSVRRAIREAARRIRAFHQRQLPRGFTMRTGEGTLSSRPVPLRRVGVYVPGGHTAYPSSVLMAVIPAQVAGVAEIAVAHPARGGIRPAVAYALRHLGVAEVYRMGGAQAIAALACGTRSVPRVDKIVGPGNAYVAMAKKRVFGRVGIDSIAGPSEVAIIADTSADPRCVALDLLAQAEHGSGDEVVFAVTENRKLASKIREETLREIDRSPARDLLERLPAGSIAVLVAPTRADSIRLVNECAPEHLQIITRTARRDAARIRNAGAIFLGPHTPVALGDYFIGTNHVLPTGGTARFSSGLGVEDFLKRMSVAEVSARGLARSAPQVSALARAEGFVHHALSVERRVG